MRLSRWGRKRPQTPASSGGLPRLAIAGGVLATMGAACATSVDGCVLPAFTLVDAGPDVEGPPPPPQCGYTYPDPPAGKDDGNDVGPFVFALRSLDMGDMGTTPGYDLDHACTCSDAGATCVGKSTSLQPYCDADGGVDNQAAKLFSLIELPLGSAAFGSQYFSSEANNGAWSLLVSLKGYNGKADDPAVEVALYPSKGLGAGNMPKWDGTDAWPIMPSAVALDGGPAYLANGAYVTNHVLVATVPTTELTFAGAVDRITARLSSGVLTANITSPDGTHFKLTGGIIAARWRVQDVFAAIASYRDNNGKPLCTDNGFGYSTAKSAICGDLDILTDGTQPKSAPCDALSIGLGFTADPAQIGPISDAGDITDGCPAATDPANDSCAK